jgi:hypothetical protein
MRISEYDNGALNFQGAVLNRVWSYGSLVREGRELSKDSGIKFYGLEVKCTLKELA